MIIKVKKLDKDARVPEFAHSDDAGMDLFSIENKTLKAGEKHIFKTGIAMEIPKDHVGLIWDKSGLAAKQGIKTMAGVVDAGYRGEIMVTLLNTSKTDYEIKEGDKIAQMLLQKVEHPQIFETDKLSKSQRESKAFGSTGR